MDLELKGKRVLITGSSRGIGRGIALGFLREGAEVVVTGRSLSALQEVRREAKSLAGKAKFFKGDLTHQSARHQLVKEFSGNGLDVLVLNLGSGKSCPGLQADEGEWIRVFQLNLFSAAETLRLFHPALCRAKKATVTVIGSIAGLHALGAPAAYGAAKAALSHWAKSMSRELAGDGIRINLVAPGNIYFKGGTWDLKQQKNLKAVRAMLKREVALQRFGSVEEIADATLFLSSNRASFITGACLIVDGGQVR